jgi:hypothetical protein
VPNQSDDAKKYGGQSVHMASEVDFRHEYPE